MDKNRFRGFSKITHEWIYGDCLHVGPDTIYIVYDGKGSREPIYTESLGQFTGLYDKTGTEIYEGDMIMFPDENDGKMIGPRPVIYGLGHFKIDDAIMPIDWYSGLNPWTLEVVGTSFEDQIYGWIL